MKGLQFVNRTGGSVTVSGRAVAAFGRTVRGQLLAPGALGYDDARKVWNGMIDRRPALIARCADRDDVQAAVAFARDHDLLVALRSGGHNVAGSATCDGGLVVDLSAMRQVEVDPQARTVRVDPGATLGEVDKATAPHGLVVPCGVVSETGLTGLTLGGGFGWFSRSFGYTCDNLLAAEVVTADGRLVTASAEENPDLLWALRGAGHNFGVVTSLLFRAQSVGPEVTAGLVAYPWRQAGDVVRFFREFTAAAPDELGTMLVLRVAPPAPFLPTEVHGTMIAMVVVCLARESEAGRRAVAELKRFGSPVADTIAVKPFVQHQTLLDAANPKGRRYYWKSHNLRPLPPAADGVVVGLGDRITSPFSVVLAMQVGGAASRVEPTSAALGHRDAAYVINMAASWTEGAEDERHIGWARDCWAAMQPFSTGGTNVNFLTAEEGASRVQAAYSPESYARLTRLKRLFDPDNLFRCNQNIPPEEVRAVRVATG